MSKHQNKIIGGSSIAFAAAMLFLALNPKGTDSSHTQSPEETIDPNNYFEKVENIGKNTKSEVTDETIGLDPGTIDNWPNRVDLWDQNSVPQNPWGVCFVCSIGGGSATSNSSRAKDLTSKESIMQVMERRLAHLQQSHYRLEITLKKLGILDSGSDVVSTEALQEKFNQFQGREMYKQWVKEDIENGPSRDGKEVLLELYNFMGTLIRILESHPEKLPDLKLSNKVIQAFSDLKEEKLFDDERNFQMAFCRSETVNFAPWMLTSHEATDQILAAFGNAAQDNASGFGSNISKHCFEMVGFSIVGVMRGFYNDDDITKEQRDGAASKNFYNPYRLHHEAIRS